MAVDLNEKVINGDKLIEFINTVKKLGDILEAVNAMDIKDAFLVGKQMGCVERVIEQRKGWEMALESCGNAMKKEVEACTEASRNFRVMAHAVEDFAATARNVKIKETIADLKELADVMDRLDKHKAAGNFEILKAIVK